MSRECLPKSSKAPSRFLSFYYVYGHFWRYSRVPGTNCALSDLSEEINVSGMSAKELEGAQQVSVFLLFVSRIGHF